MQKISIAEAEANGKFPLALGDMTIDTCGPVAADIFGHWAVLIRQNDAQVACFYEIDPVDGTHWTEIVSRFLRRDQKDTSR